MPVDYDQTYWILCYSYHIFLVITSYSFDFILKYKFCTSRLLDGKKSWPSRKKYVHASWFRIELEEHFQRECQLKKDLKKNCIIWEFYGPYLNTFTAQKKFTTTTFSNESFFWSFVKFESQNFVLKCHKCTALF